MRTDIAIALSVSGNHLFEIIICELRKIDEADAMMNVPSRIGQNWSVPSAKNLNIAPINDTVAAIRKTVSVLYLPKRYTAKKSTGGEQMANDIAHKFTGTVEVKP